MTTDERITNALRLKPMTINELSSVLCLHRNTVESHLAKLRAKGDVAFLYVNAKKLRSAAVYSLKRRLRVAA